MSQSGLNLVTPTDTANLRGALAHQTSYETSTRGYDTVMDGRGWGGVGMKARVFILLDLCWMERNEFRAVRRKNWGRLVKTNHLVMGKDTGEFFFVNL